MIVLKSLVVQKEKRNWNRYSLFDIWKTKLLFGGIGVRAAKEQISPMVCFDFILGTEHSKIPMLALKIKTNIGLSNPPRGEVEPEVGYLGFSMFFFQRLFFHARSLRLDSRFHEKRYDGKFQWAKTSEICSKSKVRTCMAKSAQYKALVKAPKAFILFQ